MQNKFIRTVLALLLVTAALFSVIVTPASAAGATTDSVLLRMDWAGFKWKVGNSIEVTR